MPPRRALLALSSGLSVAALVIGGGVATAADTRSDTGATAASVSVQSIDPATAERLTLNREEERMARDLYALFAQKYDNARPFSNITRAEQQHFDAVGALLTTYGVPDPSAGKSAGSYIPEVQKLYDAWKTQGLTSQKAALQVGVELERADIAGLEADVKATSDSTIKTTFSNLLAASRKHLQAFSYALENPTGTAPQGQRGGPAQRGRQFQPGQGPNSGQMQQPGPGGRSGPGAGRGPGAGGGGNRGDAGMCPLTSS